MKDLKNLKKIKNYKIPRNTQNAGSRVAESERLIYRQLACRGNLFKAMCLFCILGLVTGCIDYKILTPEISYLYPQDLNGKKKICIYGFEQEGGDFFKEEIVTYLKGSNQFDALTYPGVPDVRQQELFFEKENVDLVISGVMKKYTSGIGGSGSNYAIASAQVKIFDRDIDKFIWSKEDEMYIEGYVAVPSTPSSRKNMILSLQAISCKYLARKMLNDFFKKYTQSQEGKK